MTEETKLTSFEENKTELMDSLKLEVTEKPPELIPEEQAQQQEMQLTRYFDLYASKLIPLVDKLSNKSLRRVLKAAVLLPVKSDYVPNLNRPEEKMCYDLCERLFPIKMVFLERAILKSIEAEKIKMEQ